ncbi:MAG: hypothetical protein APF76_13245 [Desulfitibacter sp. BRH_c19]|nr:MAG: hypothetical protein APF76_13245 [Desulfitibacter sp. BRH_c19]
MEICPLCNGLENIQEFICPHCGIKMIDNGSINEFVGPYSPYEELTLRTDNVDNKCVHLVSCSKCGSDFRLSIDLVEL